MQKVLASAFVFLGVSVTSGSAATITETYIFSLGGFVDVGSDVSSPAKDISGSFTVTFDPTQNYTMTQVILL